MNYWKTFVTVVLLTVGSSTAWAQTVWTQNLSGSWFDRQNWTNGIPDETTPGLIPSGVAVAGSPQGGELTTNALTVGQSSAIQEHASAGLDLPGYHLNVLGDLIVAQGIGDRELLGHVTTRRLLTAGGDVRVAGNAIVGWNELGAAQTTGIGNIQGGLFGSPNGNSSLQVGLGHADGSVLGQLSAQDGVHDFSSVSVGLNELKGAATVAGELKTSAITTNARNATLSIGLNTGQELASNATGAVEVVGQGVSGFQRLILGRSTGPGSAHGTLRVQSGALAVPLIEVGQPDAVASGATANGVLELLNTSVVTESLFIGEDSRLIGQNSSLTGRVTNDGQFSVLPSGSPNRPQPFNLTGTYSQTSDGTAHFQVGGPDRGVNYSSMVVEGNALLPGWIELEFTNEYRPPIGQRFDLVSAQSIQGTPTVRVKNPPRDLALNIVSDRGQLGFVTSFPQQLPFANPASSVVNWADASLWGGQTPTSLHQVDLRNRNPESQQVNVLGNVLIQSALLTGEDATMHLAVAPTGLFATTHGLIAGEGALVTLDRGTISTSAFTLSPTSLFIGEGSLVGDVANRGRMKVGLDNTSQLAIEGDFLQDRTGKLDFGVGSADGGQFDTLIVDGQVQLDGALNIDFLDGFVVDSEFRLTLVEATGGIEGEFSSFDIPFTPGFDLGIEYGDQTVVLFSQDLTSSDLGDMNIDGEANECDIPAFALGMRNPDAYFDVYLRAPGGRGNVNEDGNFDFDDIAAFVDLVDGRICDPEAISVPEPDACIAWFAILLMMVGRSGRRRVSE